MTNKEKSRLAISEKLVGLGWAPVQSLDTGILMKNRCYCVIQGGLPIQDAKTYTFADYQAGFINTVHSTNKPWCVIKDGFLLAEGKIPRTIAECYNWLRADNCDDKVLKPLLDIVSKINKYSLIPDDLLLSYKYRESKITLQGSEETELEIIPSQSGVGSTRHFVIDAIQFPELSNYFSKDMVYYVDSVIEDSFKLIPINTTTGDYLENYAISVKIQDLDTMEHKNMILAVEIKDREQTQTQFSYSKILNTEVDDLKMDLEDFNLNSAQKAFVAVAMKEGLNFTALLNNRYDTAQLQYIIEFLRLGENCLDLVNNTLSIEHLTFLKALVENKLPITGFCDPKLTISLLEEKYSGFLQTIDEQIKVSELKLSEEARRAIYTIAFAFKGYRHVLKSASALQIMLIDLQKQEKFEKVSTLLLNSGIEYKYGVCLSWLNISQNDKADILNLFKDDLIFIQGKSWNEFLMNNAENILSVEFLKEDKLSLRFNNYTISLDSNSVFLRNNTLRVLWRAVKVNEQIYYYNDYELNSII